MSSGKRRPFWRGPDVLTHWNRVTHICVGNLTSIPSDNGLSPGRRQAIIGTNDGILLIRTSETDVSENLSEMHTFSFKEIDLKISSEKCRPFFFGLNVLRVWHHLNTNLKHVCGDSDKIGTQIFGLHYI